jgi:hypothetical protein
MRESKLECDWVSERAPHTEKLMSRSKFHGKRAKWEEEGAIVDLKVSEKKRGKKNLQFPLQSPTVQGEYTHTSEPEVLPYFSILMHASWVLARTMVLNEPLQMENSRQTDVGAVTQSHAHFINAPTQILIRHECANGEPVSYNGS